MRRKAAVVIAFAMGLLAGALLRTIIAPTDAPAVVPAAARVAVAPKPEAPAAAEVDAPLEIVNILPQDDSATSVLLAEFAKLTPTSLHQARAMYDSMEPGPLKYGALFFLVQQWARFDPRAAIEFGATQVKPPDRRAMALLVYSTLADMAAPEVLRQVSAESSDVAKQAMTIAAFETLSQRKDYDHSAQLIAQMAPELRPTFFSELTKRLPEDKLADALLWANSLGNSEQQEQARTSVAIRLSAKNPHAAAQRFNELLQSDSARQAALPDVVRNLTRKDPNAVAPWINSSTRAGLERDIAAGVYANSLLGVNRNVAIDWLVSIQDERTYTRYRDMFVRKANLVGDELDNLRSTRGKK